jgi:hypothetical protein
MELNTHYSSSSKPHLALMVLCTLVLGGLGLGLYVGWDRYLRVREYRAAVIQAGEELERLRASAAPAGPAASVSGMLLGGATSAQAPQPSLPKPVSSSHELTYRKPPEAKGPSLGDVANRSMGEEGKGIAGTFPLMKVNVGDVPAPLETEASAVVQEFFDSKQWQEKASLVHQPERVKPLMQDYYEKQKGTDPLLGKFLDSAQFQLGDRTGLALSFSGSRPGGSLEVALLPDEGGRLRLDWESCVGYSEMPLEQMKVGKVTEPNVVRVFAKRSTYYNYEFADEGRFLAVQLFSPDMVHTVHGYCERGGPVATALDEVLTRSGGADPALTLRVAFPEKAESDQCVRIVGILADRWLLLR